MKKISEMPPNNTSSTSFLGFQLEGLEKLTTTEQYTARGWYNSSEDQETNDTDNRKPEQITRESF